MRDKIAFTVRLLALMVAFCAVWRVWADTETVNGITWTYTVVNGAASVISDASWTPAIPINTTGHISIPSTLGGYPVTSIGGSAFWGCSWLTSVTIGNNVTSIGYSAFQGCTSLESVTIPDSVTSIGEGAFERCSGLTSVTIGNNVKSIGYDAFCGCSGLESVTIPDSVTSIGDSAFWGCSGLTSVTIGNNVTSIGYSAFYGCDRLTSVTIPNSVAFIGDSAFYRCSGLTSVTIGDSVTFIGDWAFYGCSGLASVTIPASVGSIGYSAFQGCTSLESVHISDLAAWCYISFSWYDSNPLYYAKNLYLDGEQITELTIPDSVTSILEYAFFGCSGLESVTIPDSVTSIRDNAFFGCNNIKNATVPGWTCTIPFANVTNLVISAGTTSIGEGAFGGCTSLESVTIPDSVTSIGGGAFEGCSGLTSVTIPDSVTSIGGGAFRSCSGLTSVTIPDSVTSIGDSAFEGCDNALYDITTISGVKLVDGWAVGNTGTLSGSLDLTGVRGIVGGAFSGCSGLTSVTIPDSVTFIGGSAFYGCSGLTSVTLPFVGSQRGKSGTSDSLFGYIFGTYSYDGSTATRQYYDLESYSYDSYSYTYYIPSGLTSVVITDETKLGYGAFYGCSGLASVTIPDSVTSIGDSAFYGCSGLESVTIPDSVTSIGNYAFAGCSGLASVTIPASVTSIADWAFYGCSGLESVTIPDSVTSIGYDAFCGCSGLTSVTIPASVTSIADWAFYGCNNIKNATVPGRKCDIPFGGVTNLVISAGTTSIADWAFNKCSRLASVTIPDSVTSIGKSAFRDCSGLVNVTMGNGVTSIGVCAFCDCSGLTSVTIGAGVTFIGDSAFSGCNNVKNATVPGWKCDIPFANVTNLVISAGTTSIRGGAFEACSRLASVTIPASVTSIGEAAFSGCSGLTSVTIPDSVTSIKNAAFSDCSRLASVTIPDSVTSIGDSAFWGCSGLESVTIGDSVTSIGNYVFRDCSGLTSVTIPDSVTSIGNYAFSGCSGLASVTMGNGVTSIGERAFSDCIGLVNVTIGDSVTSIEYRAFFGCSGLESVTIPDSVTNIGNWAFSCSGLTSVTIPNSVTSIGDSAFFWCRDLTSVTIGDSVTSIGDDAFGSCRGLTNVIFLSTNPPTGIDVSHILYSSSIKVRYPREGAEFYEGIVPESIFGGYAYLALCDYVGLYNAELSTDQEHPWQGDKDVSHDGSGSLRSGVISNDEESWVEMSVSGVGRASFWWKASSESDGDRVFDYCYLSIDGYAKGRVITDNDEYALEGIAIGGKTDWRFVEFDIEESGPHKIRWTYKKDYIDEGDVGEDCVWLDDIEFLERSWLSFDLAGGTGITPVGVSGLRGTVVTLPDQSGFAWEDHVFNGWSDGENTYSAGAEYTLPSSDVTLTAQWIAKRFLTFTLDGGEGEIPVTIKDVPNASVKLPSADGLSKAKHTFVGWSDGAKTYLPGENYQVTDSDVEFTAVWRRNEIEVTISSDVVENGGTIEVAGATISIEAVVIPGGGAEPAIYYTMDGTKPTTGSLPYTGPFMATASSVIVKAFAVLDNCFDSGVAEFSFTRLPYSPSECIDVSECEVSTGGDADWCRVLDDDAHDGVAALRSGAIGDNQSTWVEMNIDGAGEISFWCKISSQNKVRADKHDYLSFSVDGVEAVTLGGGVIGWTNMVVSIEGARAHTVKWTYLKDNDTSDGDDCAWLDEVVWSPTPSAIVTFDANGGEGGCTARMSIGTTLGEMPVPSLEFHEFQGWFTAPNGGERVTLDTIVDGDVTYYAHWTFVGGKVTWKNTGTDAIAWDGDVINESNLDFMIPATEDLPKGAKVKIDKIKLASLNSAFTGWDPTTSKSDPSYVRLNGVNSDLCSAFSGTISSTDTISDNALVYTFSTPCEVIVGKKYGAVTGNNSGDVGDGIAFLHSNGNLLYGSYADRASVRYIKTDGTDSIMSTTVAPDGYYPAYEIEAEIVELHPSAFDTQALEYTAIFANHTIKSIQGGWFKGSVSFDGGTPQNTNLRIGPSEKFDQALQTGDDAMPWKGVVPSGFVFSMALYADVSDMPKDGKAVMVALGNGYANSAILFRDGDAVSFAFVDENGGIVGETASVEVKVGYHLYCMTCDPETGEIGLSLDGAAVVKGGFAGAVALGNGFQMGSVYSRRPGDFIAGTGMAIIKLLGYDAILSAGDIQTLSIEYPAVEARVCELGAIEKPNTTVTIVDGQSVTLNAGAANLERLIVKGGLAKVRVTEELDVNGYTASFAEIINGGSLAFVSENGADISSDRVEITVTDGIATYTLKPRPQPQNNVEVGDKGSVEEGATGGYVVTAKEGEMLTEADFSFPVVAKEAYKVEIADGGKVATISLNAPEIGVPIEQEEEAPRDETDVSGVLVEVEEAMISAKPTPEAGESVGALPVKTYVGLWYQVSWGDDLGSLTEGEKVQATGDSLFLGVIKQKGDRGFYKLSVSEK